MTFRERWAWAGGFFDGEGCVRFGRTRENYSRLAAQLVQIDRQVLDRFHALIPDRSKVNGPYKTRVGRPLFTLSITGFQSVQYLACLLWPWLSPVKRSQFKLALLAARDYHRLRKDKPTNSKMTLEQARAIRQSQSSNRSLALKFGVGIRQIQNIKSGKRWRYA